MSSILLKYPFCSLYDTIDLALVIPNPDIVCNSSMVAVLIFILISVALFSLLVISLVVFLYSFISNTLFSILGHTQVLSICFIDVFSSLRYF